MYFFGRSLIFACGLSLLIGCSVFGPGTSALTIATSGGVYAPGAEVEVRLANESGGAVEFGSITCAALERRDGADWVVIESLRVCAAILYTLGPGEVLDSVFPLDETLVAGTYRLVHRVYGDISEDEGFVVHSTLFEVR